MSLEERDRLKVLAEVEAGHLKQREAALQLRMSERGFRKLLRRYRSKQDAGVVHGLRGQRSNRRLPEEITKKAVAVMGEHYHDFGPTLAAEYLEKEQGIKLSRDTLRRLLIGAGLWEAKPKQVREVHQWRPRRSCSGELVQWDTSVHAWLEERGPEKMYLIALIDDATSRLFARLVPADTTEHHMRVLWEYVERWGRPQAVYTDRAGLFQPTLAPGWRGEEPGAKTETQLGRAFRELGIEWIPAYSPQAKGRIERSFQTLQDRLVKGMRRAGVRSLEAANRYLEEEFLPEWERRYTVKAASEVDAHRPLGKTVELASTLSRVEQRQVSNDYTVSWDGQHWRLPKEAVKAGLRRSSIRIESRLDGRMMARIGGQFFELKKCEKPEKAVPKAKAEPRRHVPPPGSSRWMDHFHVRGNQAGQAGARGGGAVSAPLRSPSGLPPRR